VRMMTIRATNIARFLEAGEGNRNIAVPERLSRMHSLAKRAHLSGEIAPLRRCCIQPQHVTCAGEVAASSKHGKDSRIGVQCCPLWACKSRSGRGE